MDGACSMWCMRRQHKPAQWMYSGCIYIARLGRSARTLWQVALLAQKWAELCKLQPSLGAE